MPDPDTINATAESPSANVTESPGQAAEAQVSSSDQSTQVEPGTQSKETLLDAVLKVVPTTPEDDVLAKKTDDTGDVPGTPKEPTSEDKAEDASDAEDDGTQDDDETAPPEAAPAARKKINRLLRQRRELRDEVATLRPTARIGHEVSQFAQVNNLSGDDVAMALGVAAAISSGDYERFYTTMAPYVRRAQEELGLVLPPDLQDRVERGEMTPSAAVDFARTRFSQMRADVRVQHTEHVQATQSVVHLQSEIQRAVSAMEGRFAASDPDYKAKADIVRRTAQAMLHERGGRISSVDEALAIAKEAYDETNKRMRQFKPAPRATSPQPNGHGQTPSARAQPRTLMEAALQGLEASRAGARS